MNTIEKNKALINHYNNEFIVKGNIEVFNEVIGDDFVNHTAAPGASTGGEGVLYFFNEILRPSFSDLQVVTHHMIGEGDLVTTYKSFHCIHQNEFMGIAATGRKIIMDVMDIIRVKDGRFTEHWHVMDWTSVMSQLK